MFESGVGGHRARVNATSSSFVGDSGESASFCCICEVDCVVFGCLNSTHQQYNVIYSHELSTQ